MVKVITILVPLLAFFALLGFSDSSLLNSVTGTSAARNLAGDSNNLVTTDQTPPLKHRGGLIPSYASAEEVEVFNLNMMVSEGQIQGRHDELRIIMRIIHGVL